MQLEHHDLDIRPIPEGKAPLFINEPWLIDDSIYESMWGKKEPENSDGNILSGGTQREAQTAH
jgi:hypothetical protein